MTGIARQLYVVGQIEKIPLRTVYFNRVEKVFVTHKLILEMKGKKPRRGLKIYRR